jgi:hypothetical protein
VQISREKTADAMAIMNSTYAILFFGCPNRSMNIQSIIPMCNSKANIPFLLSIRQDSDHLRRLCRDFPIAFAHQNAKIISLYETQLSPTAQQVSPL